ncbi:MAG: DNA recombination protein RmuC [Rhodospirillaceae bacterium]|mgnify:CR=1 FL=1|jgi:DNA recombination protein RmuC|nr:DNA recombination protein RmuC [Rhodospirillaceae bacterium]MBT5079831.1 DNA recombination protein RmuC [Rhodospirillaceae bacterium]MBT5523287.1 DNA recombination protein RmuC [Rhodospirillaceae bacterium]MBT5879415.1 DNA recombination protein RmuC [Rhodospirillaceae bacterium]MBT6589178.1 DNA recombination protein RmuC [Rhodospirillaceae bacterium]
MDVLQMDIFPGVLILAILLLFGGFVLLRHLQYLHSKPSGDDERLDALAVATASLATAQADLGGRLSQMSEQTALERAELMRTLHERLDGVSKRMGDSLEQSATRTATSLGELGKHLNVIDQAQKNISDLAGQVIGLQDILDNKQTRGAFGEVQMQDLVTSILPPSAVSFQTTLSNQRRVDCLIRLPQPPGPIAVDAKFPLESYHALRQAADEGQLKAAQRAFRAALGKHIKDIQERYIVAGETADSALMFLPSEAVYAELHANFPETVEQSYRARVWIVSPTTLMATLNTVRAVLKDARMREQAGVIQGEVMKLMDDVQRLDERTQKLQTHFSQAEKDLELIATSTRKITRRAEQIEEVQLADADEPESTAIEEPKDPAANIVDLSTRGS